MLNIEVIYENGVFRPLTPVRLKEGARVEVMIIERPELPTREASQSTDAAEPVVGEELADLLDQIAQLPYTLHPDGRTDIAARHDDLLYPKHGKIP